jgi:hypothetical protein
MQEEGLSHLPFERTAGAYQYENTYIYQSTWITLEAYASTRHHTSAYVSIRQHTSAKHIHINLDYARRSGGKAPLLSRRFGPNIPLTLLVSRGAGKKKVEGSQLSHAELYVCPHTSTISRFR